MRGNDYGWSVSSFPDAVAKAQALCYACLGGTFQFWPDPSFGVYEIYWLDAESHERANGEPWGDYSERSCSEVLEKFQRLITTTDFRKIASDQQLQVEHLVFVADFVTETELADIAKKIAAL
jgi:hypothetical protein